MMNLDAAALAGNMVGAFKTQFVSKWPAIKTYGESEMKKLAQTLVMIEQLTKAGQITAEQAKLHLQIQKNATRVVMLTIEGLGLLAVEAAINAALDVVKSTVNTALGFVLI
jgi:hypothetical protein